VDGQDPRQVLARRLRSLREDRWAGRRITQLRLAQALGGVSVPLISSWESQSRPQIPPLSRLEAYASLFASERSFDGEAPHLIRPEDMSDEERQAMNELKQELTHLRSAALRATAGEPAGIGVIDEPFLAGPWHFGDGNDITMVCAQWPQPILERFPYTDIDNPDSIELLTISDPVSLFELHGHLRASNPTSQVNLRIAHKLASDDLSSHLATLGGIDWNIATTSMLNTLQLPVRQIAEWETERGQYFEVEDNGATSQYRPVLERLDDRVVRLEDVALFARAVNPYNRERTVTICNGMYSEGTYGAVRALTDARLRRRNSEYVRSRFGDSTSYCILARVPIVNGVTTTPDWTTTEHRLFEWAGLSR
jgi:transcriptional regulator with XRE-family HTH domain